MIHDPILLAAISSILYRAERQIDGQRLVDTFVDVGTLPLLQNRNAQILYGRRGTGKTHIFKVLATELERSKSNLVVYLDARVLGSTGQFADSSVDLDRRCITLFRDILSPVQARLFDHLVRQDATSDLSEALQATDELAAVISDPVKSYRESSARTTSSATKNVSLDASFSIENPTISAKDASSSSRQVERTYDIEIDHKVVFPSIYSHLSRVLDLTGTTLYLLIDEWSSVPIELQPYLAEFLKRALLPNPRAVLKIAALEYRSRFSLRQNGYFLGFELGADIATPQDLDDFYVYDRNPGQVARTFAQILFTHLSANLPPHYLRTKHRISSGTELASRLFTQTAVFEELARAAEGVVRDLLNIFSTAFLYARRGGSAAVNKAAVLKAAQKWYETDKAPHLDADMSRVLERIMTDVIGKKQARSFMLRRDLERHEILQRLIDARVLHVMHKGYADKSNPGLRYNIYSLDYGTYVDLVGTSKQPQLALFEPDFPESDPDMIVPFDDKRSIRTIILDEKYLA